MFHNNVSKHVTMHITSFQLYKKKPVQARRSLVINI